MSEKEEQSEFQQEDLFDLEETNEDWILDNQERARDMQEELKKVGE